MSRNKLRSFVISGLLILAFSSNIFSQSVTINGIVTDEFDQPGSDVLIGFIDESDTTTIFTTTTNISGEYQIVINLETRVKDLSRVETAPDDFKLYQNYPNPSNPYTTIPFELHRSGDVKIMIYNIVGQKVRALSDQYHHEGIHQIQWDGLDDNGHTLPSGVYICYMDVMGKTQTRKMVLVEGSRPVFAGAATNFKPTLSKTLTGKFYTVIIVGDKIESYEQNGILIDSDMRLDFVVKNQPAMEGTVTDIDENVYKTIKIGDQIWMAENLQVTHYRNGEVIPHITGNSEWKILSTGAYCNYANDESNVAEYGRLYNWYAANDSRNIAPAGWHVPTDEEWKQLEMYLGMSQSQADDTEWRGIDEGGKLKEPQSTTPWNSPNTGATNESGFSGLPGGYRYYGNGIFNNMGYYAAFWSSTEFTSYEAWHRYLYFDSSTIYRYNYHKSFGFSVRCVRD